MRLQFLKAIPLLLGASWSSPSTCDDSDGNFQCADLQVYISTMNKEDGHNHFYLSGDSDRKGLHVVKDEPKKGSRVTKKGSKWYIQDQNNDFLEAESGNQHVDLTNSHPDSGGEWAMCRKTGESSLFRFHSNANKDCDNSCDRPVGGEQGNASSLMRTEAQTQGSQQSEESREMLRAQSSRRRTGKCELAYADRGTDVKLLHDGESGGREWWYVEPAYCAVLDGNKLQGNWVKIHQIAGSDVGENTYDEGMSLEVHGDFQVDFSAKLKVVMKGGINFGFLSGSHKIKAKLSADLTASISADFKKFEYFSMTRHWTADQVGDTVWQWQVDMTTQGRDRDNCGHVTNPLKSLHTQLTDSPDHKPCCLPMSFHGNTWDTCTSADAMIPGVSGCKHKSQEDFTI